MTEQEFLTEEPALENIGEKSLKRILKSMVTTIEGSKTQIFDVYEAAQTETDNCRKNLEETARLTKAVINEVDALEAQEQQEKQKLVRASSSFSDYSEEKIQNAYDAVKNVQVRLGIAREKERQLRRQRNQLELRLHHSEKTVTAAHNLALRISSMMNYLGSKLSEVVTQLEAASKNKFLSTAIIRAQEDERMRVAREIHDGPAQDIANLMLEASICERLIDIDPDEAKMSIRELRKHLKECLTDVRHVIFEMRPMPLDDLGLVAAIEEMVKQFQERDGLSVEFSMEGKEMHLSDHVKTGIFRIVQEGLNNVLHHSGTKKAFMRILYTESAVSVLIEDNGAGFDMEALEAAEEEKQEHFGLLGMRERAMIIGAQISIASKPGAGTRVHLRLPVQAERAPTLQQERKV